MLYMRILKVVVHFRINCDIDHIFFDSKKIRLKNQS